MLLIKKEKYKSLILKLADPVLSRAMLITWEKSARQGELARFIKPSQPGKAGWLVTCNRIFIFRKVLHSKQVSSF